MNFSMRHTLISALVLLSSQIKAACPVGCPTLTGPAHFCNVLVDTNLNTQNLCATGNVQIGGSLSVCGTGHIYSTAASTGCTNGAFVVDGGVGIGGALNVCGAEHIYSTAASTGCTNGALIVDGGVGIAGALNVCGAITSLSGSVIPYGALITAGALDIVGADLGFGISQGLVLPGIDTIAFAAPRAGLLRNLILNVTTLSVDVGTVTAEVYVSTDGGVTWIATGISVVLTGLGTFTDLIDTYPVAQTDLIALRITPSALEIAVTVQGGLEFA